MMFKQARKAIERLYDSTCNINNYGKIKDPVTKVTKEGANIKYRNIPCRVSKQSLSKNKQTDTINQVTYEIKLFISPELEIKQGDDIEVIRYGVKEKYTAGDGFKYSSHQEVILLKDGKA